MFGATDLIVVAVVPLVASVLTFAAARRSQALRNSACLLAIGFGFTTAVVAISGRDRLALQPAEFGATAQWYHAVVEAVGHAFRPREARGWLFVLSLLAIPIALFERGLPRWRMFVWLVLFVALPVRLLWGSVYFTTDWSLGGAVLRVTAVAGALMALYLAASRPRTAKIGGPAHASKCDMFIWMVVTAGASVVLLLTGSKTYGELACALAFALLGAMVGSAIIKDNDHKNVAGLVTLIFGGLLVLGCSFAETEIWQAAALGAAAGVALLALSNTGWPRRKQLAILALMVVSVLAICAQAGFQFAEDIGAESNPYGQYR